MSPAWSLNVKLDNFTQVLDVLNFPALLRNTLVVAILGTIGAVTSAVVVAYGFARFRIPGRNGLFLLMIMTIILPFQVLLIPQYIGFKAIGWTGTWLPLIVPHFFGDGFRKSHDTKFRSAINRPVCRTDFTRDRSNVDDVPSFAFDHRR